jgi:hypothetical protein
MNTISTDEKLTYPIQFESLSSTFPMAYFKAKLESDGD